MKTLAIVAAVAAVVAIGMPDASAQCGAGPRAFASQGGMGNLNTRWDMAATADSSSIGRFWATANSDLGNNWGYTDDNPNPNTYHANPNNQKDARDPAFGRCDLDDATVGWWVPNNNTPSVHGVTGAIAAAGCEASTCPDTDLTWLVEDYGPGGDGPGSTAFYLAVMVNYDPGQTTAAGREFDLAKATGGQTGALNILVPIEFPKVQAIGSAKVGNDTQLTANFGRTDGAATDAGDGVWVDTGILTLDSDSLASIDILEAATPTDPGRERFNGSWVETASIPYADAPTSGVVHVVDCGDRTSDIWVSLGLTFKGGGGAKDVKSLLVGEAVLVQCDPDIAKPDTKVRPSARPRVDPRNDSGRSRGGR